MDIDDDEIEVVVSTEKNVDSFALSKTIWSEITGGVGIWGTFRPILAFLLSIVPFLYLGQHFNRNHQRGLDYFLLQIPLAFTLVLWVALYFWSIFDAWRESSIQVSENQFQS